MVCQNWRIRVSFQSDGTAEFRREFQLALGSAWPPETWYLTYDVQPFRIAESFSRFEQTPAEMFRVILSPWNAFVSFFFFGERNGNRKTNRSIMILKCLARNGEINLPRNEISQRGITIRDSQDNEPYQSFVSLFSFGWSHGEFVSFDRWNRIASKTIRLFKRHSTTNHRKEEKEGTRPMTERWLAGMKKEKEKKK